MLSQPINFLYSIRVQDKVAKPTNKSPIVKWDQRHAAVAMLEWKVLNELPRFVEVPMDTPHAWVHLLKITRLESAQTLEPHVPRAQACPLITMHNSKLLVCLSLAAPKSLGLFSGWIVNKLKDQLISNYRFKTVQLIGFWYLLDTPKAGYPQEISATFFNFLSTICLGLVLVVVDMHWSWTNSWTELSARRSKHWVKIQ